jgi:hypothetical protein
MRLSLNSHLNKGTLTAVRVREAYNRKPTEFDNSIDYTSYQNEKPTRLDQALNLANKNGYWISQNIHHQIEFAFYTKKGFISFEEFEKMGRPKSIWISRNSVTPTLTQRFRIFYHKIKKR